MLRRDATPEEARHKARARWKAAIRNVISKERYKRMRKGLLTAKVDKKETVTARLDRLFADFKVRLRPPSPGFSRI